MAGRSRTRASAGALIAAGLACTLLTGCSSTGVTSQTAPTTPHTSSGSPATSAVASPSWTPPDYGTAQPAVDVYLKALAGFDVAERDPLHQTSADFDMYLSGDAKTLFDQALDQRVSTGEELKGTTDTPRVKVLTNEVASLQPTVVLTDCPLPSATDPEKYYSIASGNPVPDTVKPGDAPKPYGYTIKLYELENTGWLVVQYGYTNGPTTCIP